MPTYCNSLYKAHSRRKLTSFYSKLISLIMVPLHIYMTLFHYAYSGVIYDIICAPLFGILLESYD